ncbi:MAG: hypothetical protein ABIA93_01145 [Candidatus Woesearchaeota archaeon]
MTWYVWGAYTKKGLRGFVVDTNYEPSGMYKENERFFPDLDEAAEFVVRNTDNVWAAEVMQSINPWAPADDEIFVGYRSRNAHLGLSATARTLPPELQDKLMHAVNDVALDREQFFHTRIEAPRTGRRLSLWGILGLP